MTSKKRVLGFFFVNVLIFLASNFAHPVTPTVIYDLKLPDYMFGLALAVMNATMFLFSPFWGKINSYVPYRVSLCVSCMGYALSQAMFGFAVDMAGIIIARLLAGVFIGGLFTSILGYITTTSPDEARGKYLTVYATMQSVVGAFGYFIGGMLGEISTAAAFIAQVALLAVSGVLFMLLCGPDKASDIEERPSTKQFVKECNPFAAFAAGRSFLNRAWIMLFSVCCFSYIGYIAFEQVFNYYIKDQFGLSSAYNGTIKFAVGIISLIANSTICTYLMKKTDTKKTLIPILIVGTLSIVGVIFAPDIWSFLGISVIQFAVYSVSIPLTQDMVAESAGRGDRSLIMGFYQAIRAVGGMIGSLMAGLLYDIDPMVPFMFAAAGFGISVIVEIFYYKAEQKTEISK